MTNRCVVIVRAQPPFMHWLRTLPDPVGPELTLAEVNHDAHPYLLPDYGIEDEREGLLACFHDIIFETELAGWWTVKEDWPTDRSFVRFREWFGVEFHSVVEDLVDAPLAREG